MHFSAAGEREEMIENHQLITSVILQELQHLPVKNAKTLIRFLSIPKSKYLFFLYKVILT